MRFFETRFMEEANEFIAGLDSKTVKKVFYNIDLAEQVNNPELFKKLKKRNMGVQDKIRRSSDSTFSILG